MWFRLCKLFAVFVMNGVTGAKSVKATLANLFQRRGFAVITHNPIIFSFSASVIQTSSDHHNFTTIERVFFYWTTRDKIEISIMSAVGLFIPGHSASIFGFGLFVPNPTFDVLPLDD